MTSVGQRSLGCRVEGEGRGICFFACECLAFACVSMFGSCFFVCQCLGLAVNVWVLLFLLYLLVLQSNKDAVVPETKRNHCYYHKYY